METSRFVEITFEELTPLTDRIRRRTRKSEYKEENCVNLVPISSLVVEERDPGCGWSRVC